jgi:hypothetical protein
MSFTYILTLGGAAIMDHIQRYISFWLKLFCKYSDGCKRERDHDKVVRLIDRRDPVINNQPFDDGTAKSLAPRIPEAVFRRRFSAEMSAFLFRHEIAAMAVK